MKTIMHQLTSLQFRGRDLQASFVVFLVALPLCLGIALASGAPAVSGLIAGIIGGLVVGLLSPSEISVSGPAAGLTVIVLGGIQQVGSFEIFCAIVALSGILQIALAFLRFGLIGSLIPAAVIKGMLAAIGILIILKQIPHAIGFDADYFGDESFFQIDGDNTFSAINHALSSLTPGAVVIVIASLLILLSWDRFFSKTPLRTIPAALIAVICGIVLNEWLLPLLNLQLASEHLVQVPTSALFQMSSPLEITQHLSPANLQLAATLCVVGSLETILSIDASEKMDSLKRGVNTSRELFAQGVGNMTSGLLGGLPVTAVIVRTSANVSAGGTHRLSAILHGCWLLLFALLAPQLLNRIPLSVLAVILILVGFKLTAPHLYRSLAKMGTSQFLPFIITILAILMTDLLVGVLIGFVVGLFFVIKNNLRSSMTLVNDENLYLLRFNKDTSFLNKPRLKNLLSQIPPSAHILIDGSRGVFIDADIVYMLEDFVSAAPAKKIHVELRKSSLALCPYFRE